MSAVSQIEANFVNPLSSMSQQDADSLAYLTLSNTITQELLEETEQTDVSQSTQVSVAPASQTMSLQEIMVMLASVTSSLQASLLNNEYTLNSNQSQWGQDMAKSIEKNDKVKISADGKISSTQHDQSSTNIWSKLLGYIAGAAMIIGGVACIALAPETGGGSLAGAYAAIAAGSSMIIMTSPAGTITTDALGGQISDLLKDCGVDKKEADAIGKVIASVSIAVVMGLTTMGVGAAAGISSLGSSLADAASEGFAEAGGSVAASGAGSAVVVSEAGASSALSSITNTLKGVWASVQSFTASSGGQFAVGFAQGAVSTNVAGNVMAVDAAYNPNDKNSKWYQGIEIALECIQDLTAAVLSAGMFSSIISSGGSAVSSATEGSATLSSQIKNAMPQVMYYVGNVQKAGTVATSTAKTVFDSELASLYNKVAPVQEAITLDSAMLNVNQTMQSNVISNTNSQMQSIQSVTDGLSQILAGLQASSRA